MIPGVFALFARVRIPHPLPRQFTEHSKNVRCFSVYIRAFPTFLPDFTNTNLHILSFIRSILALNPGK